MMVVEMHTWTADWERVTVIIIIIRYILKMWWSVDLDLIYNGLAWPINVCLCMVLCL